MNLTIRIGMLLAISTLALLLLTSVFSCNKRTPNGITEIPAPSGDSARLQGKSVSLVAVEGSENRLLVSDLIVNETTSEIEWKEKLFGDYDRDGIVKASDLSPIAFHFGHSSDTSGQPTDSSDPYIDGNRDGLVAAADISAIAFHWDENLIGYRAYFSLDDQFNSAEERLLKDLLRTDARPEPQPPPPNPPVFIPPTYSLDPGQFGLTEPGFLFLVPLASVGGNTQEVGDLVSEPYEIVPEFIGIAKLGILVSPNPPGNGDPLIVTDLSRDADPQNDEAFLSETNKSTKLLGVGYYPNNNWTDLTQTLIWDTQDGDFVAQVDNSQAKGIVRPLDRGRAKIRVRDSLNRFRPATKELSVYTIESIELVEKFSGAKVITIFKGSIVDFNAFGTFYDGVGRIGQIDLQGAVKWTLLPTRDGALFSIAPEGRLFTGDPSIQPGDAVYVTAQIGGPTEEQLQTPGFDPTTLVNDGVPVTSNAVVVMVTS